MQAAHASDETGPTQPSYFKAAYTGPLTTLVYRSRAAQPFSGSELLALSKAAQARNRAESITGLVVYDGSSFFQWLEGPDDSLSRVMHSILNDIRHSDVEVLVRQYTDSRTFADWDMKLAFLDDVPGPWTREIIRPPATTFEALRRRPEIAAAIMGQLAPQRAGQLRLRTSTMIEEVVRQRVIPELAARLCAPARSERAIAARRSSHKEQASRLADLVLAGDVDAVLGAVLGMVRPESRRGQKVVWRSLFETAACHLGDRWLDDACSEFDLTLGLCSLQTAARRLEQERPEAIWSAAMAGAMAGAVLIVPHPGELHGLSAALSAHAFRHDGWLVDCRFPESDLALETLLSERWFDTLDLSLSAALRREDRLPAMAGTIAMARRASRNSAMRIIAGGRIFTERDQWAAEIGADMASNAAGARGCGVGRAAGGAGRVVAEVRTTH